MKLKIKRKDIKKRVINHFNMDYVIECFENKTFDKFYKTLYSLVIIYYKWNRHRLSNEVLEECIIAIIDEIIHYNKDEADKLDYANFIKKLEYLIVNKIYIYEDVNLFYVRNEETD